MKRQSLTRSGPQTGLGLAVWSNRARRGGPWHLLRPFYEAASYRRKLIIVLQLANHFQHRGKTTWVSISVRGASPRDRNTRAGFPHRRMKEGSHVRRSPLQNIRSPRRNWPLSLQSMPAPIGKRVLDYRYNQALIVHDRGRDHSIRRCRIQRSIRCATSVHALWITAHNRGRCHPGPHVRKSWRYR